MTEIRQKICVNADETRAISKPQYFLELVQTKVKKDLMIIQ